MAPGPTSGASARPRADPGTRTGCTFRTETVTLVTELGTWSVDTSALFRYSAKDMGLEPE
ncbi:hypothetical protein QMA61_33955 [Streptomyces coelicoflavus]|uniref:hypothetical protein n=1 Tax=Streptomyces coelicoflavus TaxID=285562 RepID=UPI0024ADD831|nr:hypothetical protein [Streptomyces coelicoflavus]MDI6521189.1 hypothetical protein [Streptomyces coelicoflavus]